MKNAALLHALVHNAIDGIITIDDFGTIESINPTACKLFGYLEQEVLGNNISILMPSTYGEFHNQCLQYYKMTDDASCHRDWKRTCWSNKRRQSISL